MALMPGGKRFRLLLKKCQHFLQHKHLQHKNSTMQLQHRQSVKKMKNFSLWLSHNFFQGKSAAVIGQLLCNQPIFSNDDCFFLQNTKNCELVVTRKNKEKRFCLKILKCWLILQTRQKKRVQTQRTNKKIKQFQQLSFLCLPVPNELVCITSIFASFQRFICGDFSPLPQKTKERSTKEH